MLTTKTKIAMLELQELLGGEDDRPDWVSSIGIGSDDDKKPAIYLYVTRKVKFDIPKEIDGVPILIKVVGRVKPSLKG